MKTRTLHWRILAALVIVVLVSIMLPPRAWAVTPHIVADDGHIYLPVVFVPTVILPPDSTTFGLTYAEWSSKWWQWVLAQPEGINPGFDATGIHCAQGQSGPVWFLGAAFDAAGPLTRSCTIPHDTALFLPVLTSAYVGFPTVPEDTPQFALETVRQDMDSFLSQSSLFAEVDGMQVTDFLNYRRASPVFDASLPPNNPFGIMETDCPANDVGLLACGSRSAADGVYLMLAPLSPGSHTVHVRTLGPITLEMTYNIIITDSSD